MIGHNERLEQVSAGDRILLDPPAFGVDLRVFVSGARGAIGFSTGLASFEPGSELPIHTHDCSEAITVLEGEITCLVEDRSYRLGPLDCIHVPKAIVHGVRNHHAGKAVLHSAFGSTQPMRYFAEPRHHRYDDRGLDNPEPNDPEAIRRFAQCEVYELSPGAYFTDLFARRFGSVGICGGYGRFLPGSSLPCHTHEFDESITIVTGEAACQVQGARYQLSGYETAFVPRHRPHRFLNETQHPMAMIWVYAGDEPDRLIVPNEYCSGALSTT